MVRPPLVPERNTSGVDASTAPNNSFSVIASASVHARPYRENTPTAGPAAYPIIISPRTASARTTGATACAPPGSFPLNSIRLGEFMPVRYYFLERFHEQVNMPGRIRILAHVGKGNLLFGHAFHNRTNAIGIIRIAVVVGIFLKRKMGVVERFSLLKK